MTPRTRSLPRIGTRARSICCGRCLRTTVHTDRVLLGERVDDERLTRSDHASPTCRRRWARPVARRSGARRARRRIEVRIRLARGSYQRMPMSPEWNTSRSLSPTRSTMAWKSSSAAMPLLDAVDHRQLGGALLGFLQQALGLVEEARVLQRHAHARRDRAEQAHLGLAEGVLALVVLEDDRAQDAIAAENRAPGRSRCTGRCLDVLIPDATHLSGVFRTNGWRVRAIVSAHAARL